ncbi:MAG: Arc family DNA-binding protein [Candidatus Riflebacteria bacterium]|nr:Arc family DNA-binding protein [Candidatus Riflebacteria bacterium]
MATITLKNVPRMVHLEIKKRAERNHRSINSEIVTCLERILGLRADEVDDVLARMEKVQKGLRFVVTDEDVRRAKIEGRK